MRKSVARVGVLTAVCCCAGSVYGQECCEPIWMDQFTPRSFTDEVDTIDFYVFVAYWQDGC